MSAGWPRLVYEEWRATCDTVHAHTQLLGKLAVALAPPEPQLQHAALRLTARGWETNPLPAPDGSGALVATLDLRAHEAVVEHTGGRTRRIALAPDRAVGAVAWWPGDERYEQAAFYAYAQPSVDAFAGASLSPAAARWHAELGEYVLDWDDVRSGPDPHGAALQFPRSAFQHACAVCGWDAD